MNLGVFYEIKNELDEALKNFMQSTKLRTQLKDESCLTSLIAASTILIQMNKTGSKNSARRGKKI